MVDRNLNDQQEADYIISYLEGQAKEELKLRMASKRYTGTKVRAILIEAFGERRSLTQLLKSFYDCKQSGDESIRSFSLALCELYQRIISRNPSASSTRDQAIRERPPPVKRAQENGANSSRLQVPQSKRGSLTLE